MGLQKVLVSISSLFNNRPFNAFFYRIVINHCCTEISRNIKSLYFASIQYIQNIKCSDSLLSQFSSDFGANISNFFFHLVSIHIETRSHAQTHTYLTSKGLFQVTKCSKNRIVDIPKGKKHIISCAGH